MKVLATQHRIVYLVEFDAKEAAELRAIRMLPPIVGPEPAQLWLTIDEINAMINELPLSRELKGELGYMVVRLVSAPS